MTPVRETGAGSRRKAAHPRPLPEPLASVNELIREAAVELLGRKGLGTTFDDIAEHALSALIAQAIEDDPRIVPVPGGKFELASARADRHDAGRQVRQAAAGQTMSFAPEPYSVGSGHD